MKSINHCICLVFLCNLPHISSDYLAGITDLDFPFSLSPAAHVIELKKKKRKRVQSYFWGYSYGLLQTEDRYQTSQVMGQAYLNID